MTAIACVGDERHTPATGEITARIGRPGADAAARGGAREEVPGRAMPAVAQTLAWAAAPTWLMRRFAGQLGETFRMTFAPSGRSLVMISDPEAVKAVFTASPEIAPVGGATARRSPGCSGRAR